MRACQLLCLLAFLVLGGAQSVHAQRQSVPDGTIYLARGTQVLGLRPDGSNLVQVLPTGFSNLTTFLRPTPSDLVYGTDTVHDRWWLTMEITGYYDTYQSEFRTYQNFPHHDLFAVRTNPSNRSQLIKVQLTDLYGRIMLQRAGSWDNFPFWLPDAQGVSDGIVVHPYVFDIRSRFQVDELGRSVVTAPTIDSPDPAQLRLPITGDMIQDSWRNGTSVAFGPDNLLEEEFNLLLELALLPTYSSGLYGPRPGITSPDGNYFLRNSANGYFISNLESTNVFQYDPIGTGATNSHFPQWAPNSATVLLVDGTASIDGKTSSGGSLYLAPAFGNPPRLLRAAQTVVQKRTRYETRYFDSVWSPNSTHLVTRTLKLTNGTKTSEGLSRVSATDGSVVDLKINTTGYHVILGWSSSRAAN